MLDMEERMWSPLFDNFTENEVGQLLFGKSLTRDSLKKLLLYKYPSDGDSDIGYAVDCAIDDLNDSEVYQSGLVIHTKILTEYRIFVVMIKIQNRLVSVEAGFNRLTLVKRLLHDLGNSIEQAENAY